MGGRGTRGATRSGGATAKASPKKARAKKTLPSDKDMLDAIVSVNPRAATGDVTLFGEIRAKFPKLSKEQFDAAMLKLGAQRKVTLHWYDDNGGGLTEKQRQTYVRGVQEGTTTRHKKGDPVWYNVVSINQD